LGVVTNREMLIAVLGSFPFFAGDTTTAFLSEHPTLLNPTAEPLGAPPAEVLVAAAFRHLEGLDFAGDWIRDPYQGNFAMDPVPPRWRNVAGTPGFVGLTWGAGNHKQHVWVKFDSRRDFAWQVSISNGPGPFDGQSSPVGLVRVIMPAGQDGDLLPTPDTQVFVEIDGLSTRLETVQDLAGTIHVTGPDHRFSFQVRPTTSSADQDVADLGPVAPVPGTVAAIEVEPGEHVEAGQTLVVLEAMKMEHRITADAPGTIADVLVALGQSVDAHQLLVTFAATGEVEMTEKGDHHE